MSFPRPFQALTNQVLTPIGTLRTKALDMVDAFAARLRAPEDLAASLRDLLAAEVTHLLVQHEIAILKRNAPHLEIDPEAAPSVHVLEQLAKLARHSDAVTLWQVRGSVGACPRLEDVR